MLRTLSSRAFPILWLVFLNISLQGFWHSQNAQQSIHERASSKSLREQKTAFIEYQHIVGQKGNTVFSPELFTDSAAVLVSRTGLLLSNLHTAEIKCCISPRFKSRFSVRAGHFESNQNSQNTATPIYTSAPPKLRLGGHTIHSFEFHSPGYLLHSTRYKRRACPAAVGKSLCLLRHQSQQS